MSTLTMLEKQIFEDLFGMAGGYVLDFTNRTFSELVEEAVSKEIYADAYGFMGNSKANRLRAFWKLESNPVVGKLLYALLEWGEEQNSLQEGSGKVNQARAIIQKLMGIGDLPNIPRGNDDIDLQRIWGHNYDSAYLVFLSHTDLHKVEAEELKTQLEIYGIRSFVAPADIDPTQEWILEIENALSSMNGLIALLTSDFHKSLWTDQEIGHAMGRGIQPISVMLGAEPYGFIGKYQAFHSPSRRDKSSAPGDSHWDWRDTARKIVEILIKEDQMLGAYIEAVRTSKNFSSSNTLYEILPKIESISNQRVDELISAYHQNHQVSVNHRFSGRLGNKGLVHYLNQLSDRKFKMDGENIREAKG